MPLVVLGVHLADAGFDWPAWITAASTVVATLIVLVTAKVALDGLADARRTRNAQLVTDLSRRWDEPLMVESVNLSSKYGSREITDLVERLYDPPPDEPGEDDNRRREKDLALYAKLFIWPNLLEMIGSLHAERALSTEIVAKLWGAEVIAAWDAWQEPIRRLRELEQDWGIYRPFERLVEEMTPLHEAARVRAEESPP
ncbi:MAG: hypothetical protein WD689_11925 [Gaiellaceae bacterium]